MGQKRLLRPQKYFQVAALYLLGIGLIFISNYHKPDSLWGVFLTSLISIPFYIFLITRYDYSHNLPLLFYISMSLLRIGIIGLYIAYIFCNGTYLNLSPVWSSGYDFIYFGGLIMAIGNLVFVITCLFLWDKLHHERASDRPVQGVNNHDLILKTGVILLILAILLEFSDRFIHFKNFGQAFVYFLIYAGPAGLLLLVIYKSYNKLPNAVVIFVLIFLVAKTLTLLDAFFRQQIIIYLLPLSYYLYVKIFKKKKRERIRYAFILGTSGFLMILIVFNYVRLHRSWVLSMHSLPSYTIKAELLSNAITSLIPFTEPFREENYLPNGGVWAVLSRSNLYTISAWVYNNVDNFGYKKDMIRCIGRSIIPRLFFPDKEPIVLGKEFYVELGLAKDVESATTSVGVGMFPGYYRNYGWIGVICGAVISGMLYSILINYSRSRYLYNPFMSIIYFVLIVESLRWFESGFDGSISFFALMFIVFIPASLVYEKTILCKNYISRANP